MKGIGVDKNPKQAFKWGQKSAQQGYIGALYILGALYSKGLGINKDDNIAFKCIRASAIGDDKFGQCSLGVSYKRGYPITINYPLAHYWFTRAKDSGNYFTENHFQQLSTKPCKFSDELNYITKSGLAKVFYSKSTSRVDFKRFTSKRNHSINLKK